MELLHYILFVQLVVVCSQEYSFCSEDNLFSFNIHECPGGVLLKRPITIDEPCYCFGADLQIHEDCGSGEGVTRAATEQGCQAPLIQQADTWNGKARLFLPLENSTQGPTGDVEYCPKIRDSCKSVNTRTLMASSQAIFNEVDEDEDYTRKIRQDSNENRCPLFSRHNCTDSKTKSISDIVEMLTYVQNKVRFNVISHVFKLLKHSVEVFKALSPEWMIPDKTMDSLFSIFHLKFITLDGMRTDKYMTEDTFLELKRRLEKCLSEVKELSFIKDNSTCPPKVGQFIKVDEHTGDTALEDAVMPQEQRYKYNEEDLLVGVMWKVVDTVHTKCLSYNHYYFTNMENLFLDSLILERHYKTNGFGALLYTSIVDHDDLRVFMENIDKIDAVVHSSAKYKAYFQKPQRSTKEPKIRRKRSLGYKEIWEGRAYCMLNKQDSSTLFKNDPELKKICRKDTQRHGFRCKDYEMKGRIPHFECLHKAWGYDIGFFRLKSNMKTEHCCYEPKKCAGGEICLEICENFCQSMKSQLLSYDEKRCKCQHSDDFISLMQTK